MLSLLVQRLVKPRRLILALATGGLLAASVTARAQLASEVTLYTFDQRLGFYGASLDYPPLIQAPGLSNSGIAIYGIKPVTGNGNGGEGIFAYSAGQVSTLYTDPNGSAVANVFTGDGGTTAYAVTSEGLISLPGGSVINPGHFAPIIKASDGTFYGFGGNGFERITDGGAATIASPAIGPIQLVQGSDGNFYVMGVSGFTEITADSAVIPLYSFPNSVTSPAGIVEATGSGADKFYGYRASGTGDANYSGAGILFTFTKDPGGATSSLTILHNLLEDGSEGNRPNCLLLARDGNLYGTTASGGLNGAGTLFRLTPSGDFSTVYAFDSQTGGGPVSVAQLGDGNFYVVCQYGGTSGGETIVELIAHPPFFAGETSLGSGVYYATFPGGNYFGYYSYLTDPNYLYHFDLGYEYVFDAGDGKGGVYLYDFASNGFFYTSPSFPFPYLYDFSLNTVLYYYPDPNNAGHYNTDGIRYFYRFDTGAIFSK